MLCISKLDREDKFKRGAEDLFVVEVRVTVLCILQTMYHEMKVVMYLTLFHSKQPKLF